MFRTLPPTAAPLPFRDLVLAGLSAISKPPSESRFRDQLRRYFGIKHAFPVFSGKAALTLALGALRKSLKREEVILPGYSSFCLASAAARSRLSVRLCDIDPATLDFDFRELALLVTEKTLAVVAVHPYGLVCDMEKIMKLASAKGAFVIEDAAQAAGASFKGRNVGTMGDLGIMSLGRGKNISALGGGVILTENRALALQIEEAIEKSPRLPGLLNLKSFVEGFGLSLLLHPERYTLPSRLPFLDLGANIFNPDFKVGRLPSLNTNLGERTFSRLDAYNEVRVRHARWLRAGLCGLDSISLPKANAESRPVYLRFPILLKDRPTRDDLFGRMTEKRVGASLGYPKPLNEIAPFRECLADQRELPGAKFVAERILTLPTHPYLREKDINNILEVFVHPFGARSSLFQGGVKSAAQGKP